MICLYCKKPIVKYPAFSQHDPVWVHEFEGMPWGSTYCEGNNPATRINNTIATPDRAEKMSYRESMIDAGRGHLLRGGE